MARTLPEAFGNRPLVIPAGSDPFQVVTDGGPGLDRDCIEVVNPTVSTWTAYDRVTPSVLPTSTTEAGHNSMLWTLNIWVKVATPTGTGMLWRLGQRNRSETGSAAGNYQTNSCYGQTSSYRATQRFFSEITSYLSQNVWTMMTHCQVGQDRKVYRNGALIAASNATTGGLAAITLPEFSLGLWKEDSNTWHSVPCASGAIQFGPMSIWQNRALTQAEVINLYQAMLLEAA